MKFLSYKFNDVESYGILNENNNTVIPMTTLLSDLKKECPTNLLGFIQMYSDSMNLDIEKFLNKDYPDEISMDDVKIISPIPNPKRNVFCLGKNYVDHIEELSNMVDSNIDIPKYPIYFTKVADPAIGHNDKVIIPKNYTVKIDYEVELAVIIGKDGRDISPENVEEYIFGYSISNDISARDTQVKHSQWFKGKSFDTFTPIGPYIADKTEIQFPVELDLSCKVNGELRQNSNTRNLIFNIPHIVSDLSKGLTLRAGDIILTGTPSGVGVGFKPHKYLKSGDIVECYIEKIGTLLNIIE